MTQTPRKIAVVHDFLYCYAGAERVLEQIIRLYPQADLFALFDFLPPSQRNFLGGRAVNTSFLQRMPAARKRHRNYLPLMPLAVEQLDVSSYDLVISSSYVAAKGVLTRPDQLHICYCHSPARFAWDLQNQYLSESGLHRGVKSVLARLILHYFRAWDVRSANSVDVFIANSETVAQRIRKIYRRDSIRVYPPVDLEQFLPRLEKEDFYLTASRLVPYKKINLIVQAFSSTPKRKLIVIGEGPDFAKIARLAGPNITMLGFQSGQSLRDHMQRARAFVFAAEEDFGIVPLEAQACGTPVIGLGRGGLVETIIPGETGLFFDEQTPQSLLKALDDFESRPFWDAELIRRNAERFSIARFCDEFSGVVESQWDDFQSRRQRLSGMTGIVEESRKIPIRIGAK
ncbi:MAG: glycosyltransferase family 4 protein [Tepidisphaeraceae bacterium]|jgi:glycosyltransferase involved in cell wall biosynthesis